MMSRRGFTIIEVLLFLAISGLLLMIALAAVTGTINNTRFSDATNGLESFLSQQYSEVQSGVSFRPDGDIACVPAGSPEKPGAANNCIVLGRLIDFVPLSDLGPGNPVGLLRSYTVVGTRCPDVPDPVEAGCPGGSGVTDGTEAGKLAAYSPRAIRSAVPSDHYLQWGAFLPQNVQVGGVSQPNPAVMRSGSKVRFNRLAILHAPTSERVYVYAYSHADSFTEVEQEYVIPRSFLTEAVADKEAIMCLQSQDLFGGYHFVSIGNGQGSDLIVSGERDDIGALRCH